jgi:ribosome-associated toxin RatA of RatAB toxin-antitoxin module
VVSLAEESTDSLVVVPALLPENSPERGAAPPQGSGLKVVERSAIVGFSAAQMFALVNDVGRYPEFLPWCDAARVEDVSSTIRIATVNIARGLLKTHFTTQNHLAPDTEILMNLLDGPFRSLTGQWRFEAIGERGSRVSFRVEFEFKNTLMAAAFNAIFETLCGTIVAAFVQRASEIYA